ncbi:MAG: hypothetical protein ACE5MM_10165 [Nitrospiraceae bacterium]
MGKITTIQLHNGKELTYSDVTRVEEDRFQVKIYRERELLAVIDTGDIKNLYTEES